MTHADFVNVLKRMGFQEIRAGNHTKYMHPDGRSTVVPFHSGRMSRGLILGILRRDLHMTPEELTRFMQGLPPRKQSPEEMHQEMQHLEQSIIALEQEQSTLVSELAGKMMPDIRQQKVNRLKDVKQQLQQFNTQWEQFAA